MKVTDFAVAVAEQEGKKIQVSIAQIKEILRIANDMTNGDLYYSIRELKEVK
jgi:hypothetical protein